MTGHDDQLAPIDGAITAPPPSGIEVVSGNLEDLVLPPSLPPAGQPLGYPDTDAIQAVADLQREMLAQPAGNVIQGAPHFLRNVGGEEICGQCGNPWMCDGYKDLLVRDAERARATSERAMPQVELAPPTMAEAAAAAGVDLEEFQARLLQTRRQ